MQVLNFFVLFSLTLLATVKAASISDKVDSADGMVKRYHCNNGYHHGTRNGGMCVPDNPVYPTCERVCISGQQLPMGKPTQCPQQFRDAYKIVGHTTHVTSSPDKKEWNIRSIDRPDLSMRFQGSIQKDGRLQLSATSDAWTGLTNNQRFDIVWTDYFFEYKVGEWTYYYKVQGSKTCVTPGPGEYNLFTELSTVAVLEKIK